jgi:hypothetical protein
LKNLNVIEAAGDPTVPDRFAEIDDAAMGLPVVSVVGGTGAKLSVVDAGATTDSTAATGGQPEFAELLKELPGHEAYHQYVPAIVGVHAPDG